MRGKGARRRAGGGLAVASIALLGCAAEPRDGDSGAGGGGHVFEEVPDLAVAPDVRGDRLCVEAANPDDASDFVNIDCRIEADRGAAAAEPKDEIVVMVYNFERGLRLDEQVAALRDDPALGLPDVILASELDRGCSRTGHRDVTRELADALGMSYAFGVEFLELPRASGGGGEILETCEHGNAVLSRYPLGNVGVIRHAQNRSWYVPPEERTGEGEPRLGGRMVVYADVKVGERYLHVYALHFESDLAANDIQVAQAVETAQHGLARPFRVVQGGDTNAPLYWLDLMQGTTNDRTVGAYLDLGYVDAHASVPSDQRGTRGALVLDLLFADGEFTHTPRRCPPERCGDLSDHLPVWATVRVAGSD